MSVYFLTEFLKYFFRVFFICLYVMTTLLITLISLFSNLISQTHYLKPTISLYFFGHGSQNVCFFFNLWIC
jgi:hypothetical protein